MTTINKLFEKLESQRSNPNLSLDVDRMISEQLNELEDDLYYIDREDGFKRHVQDQLKDLSESQIAVCNCANYLCPPKRGNLPNRMRYVDVKDFDKVLDEYQMTHENPEWVTMVRESWIDRKKRVKRSLQDCIRAARMNSEEPLKN
jgi:hypothetical protein